MCILRMYIAKLSQSSQVASKFKRTPQYLNSGEYTSTIIDKNIDHLKDILFSLTINIEQKSTWIRRKRGANKQSSFLIFTTYSFFTIVEYNREFITILLFHKFCLYRHFECFESVYWGDIFDFTK